MQKKIATCIWKVDVVIPYGIFPLFQRLEFTIAQQPNRIVLEMDFHVKY